MATNWAELLLGKTPAQVLDDLLARIKGMGFPVDDWESGGVVRTILQQALSPAVSSIWAAITGIAQGGFVRLAQALAEADIATWNASPENTWLHLLAQQHYLVTPNPPSFTVGLMRFENTSTANYTVTPTTAVTVNRVRFTPTGTTPLPAKTVVFIEVKATEVGPVGNVAPGLFGTLNVSMPGVVVTTTPNPPSTTWITTYGATRESPKGVADRCVFRLAAQNPLQATPADAYRYLALAANPNVKKVAVWPNYSHQILGFQSNTVTLYLGSDAGPVPLLVAVEVRDRLRPYIGLHDVLECQPCGMVTWSPLGIVVFSPPGAEAAVRAAVELRRQQLQTALQIGAVGYAWAVRACMDVPNVVNFVDLIVDFIPPQNALIIVDFSQIRFRAA